MSSPRTTRTPRTPRTPPTARNARAGEHITKARQGRGARRTASRAAATGPAASSRPKAPATVALGTAVADFSLPATGGSDWQLSQARGRKLVIYFYPRDNTPGCTLEGRDFAALAPRFAAAGTDIVGISRDSLASHEKFRDKMGFPFALLSDADETICRQFDVIRLKHLYGRSFPGVERSTFLLDSHGVLRREWRKVQVSGHAQAVLAAAESL